MPVPGKSRVPKVRWLVLATVVLVVGGAGLRWWTARTTIREIHRLGGSTALSSSSWIPPALHTVLALDVNIDQLDFHGTTVPDEFFKRLGNVHSLQIAVFRKCTVSDAALKRFRDVPTLVELALDECQATDATAEALTELRQLRMLSLPRTKITDAAIPEIAKLSELTYLGLSHTAVGDKELESLKGLSKLRWLDLSHTDVTDTGLEKLHGTTVNGLDLRGTKATIEGVARLQATMRGKVLGP